MNTWTFNVSVYLTDLTFNDLTDRVFHTNIIAYCQQNQNQHVRLAIYTDSFTLMTVFGENF